MKGYALEEVTLAETLSAAGFTTMMISDTPHTLENGFFYDRGFDGWEWIHGQETDNPRNPGSCGLHIAVARTDVALHPKGRKRVCRNDG